MTQDSQPAMATSATTSFVLMDVPKLGSDRYDYLTDYIQAELEVSDIHLLFHPDLPDRVLVTTKEGIDVAKAGSKIEDKPIGESNEFMRIEAGKASPTAVIVEEKDLKKRLPLLFLELYFQKEFAEGDEIVKDCVLIPQQTQMAAVRFENAEVTKRVLDYQVHTPLPKKQYNIEVKPFFLNFHGEIQLQGKPLDEILGAEGREDPKAKYLKSIKRKEEERSKGKCKEDSNSPHDAHDESSGNRGSTCQSSAGACGTSFNQPPGNGYQRTESNSFQSFHTGDRGTSENDGHGHAMPSGSSNYSRQETSHSSTRDRGTSENHGHGHGHAMPSDSSNYSRQETSHSSTRDSGQACLHMSPSHFGNNNRSVSMDDGTSQLRSKSNASLQPGTDGKPKLKKQLSLQGTADEDDEEPMRNNPTYRHDKRKSSSSSSSGQGKQEIKTPVSANRSVYRIPIESNSPGAGRGTTINSYNHKSYAGVCGSSNSTGVVLKNQNSETRKHDYERKYGQPWEKQLGPEELPLDEAIWKVLKQKLLLMEKGSVKYVPEKGILLVSNHESHDIQQFLDDIKKLKAQIYLRHIQLNVYMEQLLSSEWAKKYLTLDLPDVHWNIKHGQLHAYSLDNEKLDKFFLKLDDMKKNLIIRVIPYSLSPENYEQCKDYEDNFMVKLLLDPKQIDMRILGIEGDVDRVQKHILKRFNAPRLTSASIARDQETKYLSEFPKCHFKFIDRFFFKKEEFALRNVKRHFVSASDTRNMIIELTGNESDTKKAMDELKRFEECIQHGVIDVSKDFDASLSQFLNKKLSSLREHDQLYRLLWEFEESHKCLISTVPHSHKFHVSSSLKLEVKNDAKIENDHSEMLVCTLTENRKLTTTSVGKAFLQLVPSLQDTVDGLNLSLWNVKVSLVHYPKNGVRRYVAFVVLPKFDNIISGEKFQKAVMDILSEAKYRPISRICFPSLGSGVMLSYPADFISTYFLRGLKSFAKENETAQLSKVTMLARTNDFLFEKMGHLAPQFFPNEYISLQNIEIVYRRAEDVSLDAVSNLRSKLINYYCQEQEYSTPCYSETSI